MVGSKSPNNIATFAEVISKIISLSSISESIEILQVPEFTRPTSVPYLIADTKKFSALTGWSPTYNLEEILIDTLNYWRVRVKENPNL